MFRIWVFAVILGLIGSQVNVYAASSEDSENEGISIEELSATIKQLEAKIKRLTKEKEDTLKSYNKSMEDRIADSNEIRKLNQQINQEIKKTEDIKQEIKPLQTELDSAKKAIRSLQSELDQAKQENKRLTENIAVQQQEANTLTTTLKEKEQSIANLDKQLQKLQPYLAEIQKTLKEKEEIIAKYQSKEKEIETLHQQITSEKNKSEALTKDVNKQLEDNKRLYEIYTKKIAELQDKEAVTNLFVEEGKRYQGYVNELYKLKLNKINDLNIAELKYCITNYQTDKSDEFQYLIAGLYASENKNYEACAVYLKIMTLYPESKFASQAKIQIKQLEKKFSKGFYNKVSKLPSLQAETKQARFLVYLKDLHNLNISHLYKYCLEQQEEFLRLYNDSEVDIYMQMAETYIRLKEEYKAIATYLKITQLYPLYPEASRLSDVYYAIGDTFANIKEYKNATAFYEKGLEQFPKYSKAPAYLLTSARMYQDRLKMNEKAILTYNQLVKEYPESQQAVISLSELAVLYEDMKRYQDAIKTYEQLVKEYPKELLAPQSLIQAGKCYERINDYFNAVSMYLRLDNEYATYKGTPEQVFQAGVLCEKELNDINRAIEIYNQIIAKYPNDEFAEDAQSRIKKLSK